MEEEEKKHFKQIHNIIGNQTKNEISYASVNIILKKQKKKRRRICKKSFPIV